MQRRQTENLVKPLLIVINICENVPNFDVCICYTMPSRDLCKIHEGMFDKPEGVARGFGNMLNTPQAVPLICKASVVQI